MDGPTAQSYAQVRKSVSAYEHALRGIECIKRVGIKISISMVLMKGNIQYIPEFLKLAEYMCVDSVRFVDFIPTGRGQLNACADAYELRAAYQVINEYIHKSEHIPVIVPTKTRRNAFSLYPQLIPVFTPTTVNTAKPTVSIISIVLS